MLADLHAQIKSLRTAHDEIGTQLSQMESVVAAEMARKVTFDDIRGMVDRMAADAAHTG